MLKNFRNEGWRWATRHSRLLAMAAFLLLAVGALPAMSGTAKAAGTGIVAVCATDSTGTNIVLGGDQAWVQANGGSILYVGAIGDSNCRESTFAAGASVETWVAKDGTYSNHQTITIVADQTVRVDFYTTKVTPKYTGALAFGGPSGDSAHWLTASKELFSDGVSPVHFRLSGTGTVPGRLGLVWPVANGTGATYNVSLAVARVRDSSGDPLEGASVDGWAGGWFSAGTTNIDGIVAFAHAGTGAITSVAATYNGTREQIDQSSFTNSVYQFQTTLVNVKLNDADGNPLDTGTAAYYAFGWQPSVSTSGGVANFEMLPGSYSFEMWYNHTHQQLNGVVIGGPTTDVVFQTGRVTAYFSQPFYWFNSQFYLFSPSVLEFLPGQIGLQLPVNGCQTPKFLIAAGDHLVKTGIVATLVDSANHPLSGGIATAYAGGWKDVGTTDASGRTCAALDGHLGNTAVAMVYNGTRQQISQNAQVNGIYAFQTGDVTIELRNSSNALFDTGNASYYASGWHNLGATSSGVIHVQMLPGSYSFAMTYEGTRQQQNSVAVANGSTVVFQTAAVTVDLKDSGNSPLAGNASYYASGWHSIAGTTVEMLPGSYSFAMTYNGTREQKNSVSIGLPSTTVSFQTIDVEVKLQDHAGGALSGNASYYAGGWHAIAGTSVEMLPGSYSFAMTYNGTREQRNGVNITTTNPVVFQTGQVNWATCTATQYYAGGWRSFANGQEMLPGTYWFGFSDHAQMQNPLAIVGGSINNFSCS